MGCVGFPQEEQRLTAACGLDAQPVDSSAVPLSPLNSDPEVFVSCKGHAFRRGSVASERDHASHDERINTLPLTLGVHKAHRDVDLHLSGERDGLSGRSLGSAVVPISPE